MHLCLFKHHTQTDKQRQKERQADRQAERQRGRQADRQTEREPQRTNGRATDRNDLSPCKVISLVLLLPSDGGTVQSRPIMS